MVLFFATWVDIFQFARTFLDFLPFCKEKLPKFTRCGGLEALEEDFGIHFGGYLSRKRVKVGSIFTEKVDRRREWHAKIDEGANGAHNSIKFSPRFPFPHCSGYGKRECAVPLGWGASPLGGV